MSNLLNGFWALVPYRWQVLIAQELPRWRSCRYRYRPTACC
jgi:hypothetical protein